MGLLPAWVSDVRMVANGDPVDAEYTNRAPADLAQRTEHLRALIGSLGQGTALYLRNAAVDSAVAGGAAVYYDGAGPVFRPARAVIDFTGNLGAVAATSYVVGVIERKLSASVADIVTAGCVAIDDFTMLDEPYVSGPRYLSPSRPGFLSAVKPVFAIYVGFWMAEAGTLVVSPEMRDGIDNHTHYRFKLHAVPAGTANSPSYMDRVTVVSPNPLLPGWLPANHPVFGGKAPAGAKFGYNLSRHPELFAVYPPVPVDSAAIEVCLDGQGTGREFDRVVVVNNDGIWWLRDDWGWGPWEIDTASVPDTVPSVDPETPPPVALAHGHGYTGSGKQCPMSMHLWFSRPNFLNENSVVTSLTAPEGSALSIVGCDGKPASAGALVIDADLNLTDDGANHGGCRVVKGFDGARAKFGLVAEGVKSLSSIITVDSADGLLPDADGYYAGRIDIGYNDPSQSSREFDVALFALDRAEQTVDQDIYYISFPAGASSAVRGRVDLPSVNLGSGTLSMTIRLRIVATAPGSLPSLAMTYRRVPASSMASPNVLPGSGAEVTAGNLNLASANNGSAVAVANTYFDFVSSTLLVVAGDNVFFTVRRAVDGYSGKIGIISARARIG